jgi:hypothetical protein
MHLVPLANYLYSNPLKIIRKFQITYIFSNILERHQYVSASIYKNISSPNSSIFDGREKSCIFTGKYSFINTAINGDAISLIP